MVVFCLAGLRKDFQTAIVGQCFILTITLEVYGAPGTFQAGSCQWEEEG